MSLETLLEAAKYLEYRTEAKARGEEPQDYTTYSRLFANGGSTPSVSQENNGDSSPNHIDEFKDRRRASGAGTREVHNKLEKNRRAHLKECFETLKRQIPNMDDKKTSNLSILRSALRYIQALKRKERDYEHEMERLAREKIASQQRLASLKKELSSQLDNVDVNTLIPEADNDTNSTSTASECGPLSDIEEEEKVEVPQVISAQSSMNTSTVITTASVLTNLSKVTASSLPSDVKPPVSSSTVIQHHVHLTQPVTTTQCGHSMVTLATAASTAVPRPIVSFTPTITAKSSSLQMASMSQSVHQSPVQAQPTAATIQVPQPTLQTIAVSKAATAIAMNALTSQVSATHLQIPAQMVSHPGIQMNGGPSVIAHPAVQVIAQPGVRVISAAPNTTLGTLSSQVATTGNITSSSTSSINMMAQKTAVVTAVTATQSVAKTAIVPSVTLTKQNLLPVSVTTMVAQNGPPMAQSKGLVASGTNPGTTTIPVTVAQLAVKATGSGVSTLSIPTSITALPRSVALQTSSTPTQGIVSLTGVNGALSSTATMQLPNVCKPTAQLLQPTLTQRTVTQHPVYSQNNQGSAITTHSVNNLTRHLMTAAVKPMAPVRTPITQITHVVQPTPIASVGQLVSSGNHMSAVTPLVAPMSVVNHAAVAQVLAQPQLGKVTVASPLLKSVGQIPLMQQQFLQPAQPLVKPVVVVTAPSIVTSSVANTPQASPQTVQVSLPGSH